MQPGEHDEIRSIRSELEALRAQVDAVGSAGRPSWWARALPGPKLAKRLTRVGLVGLMLAMPVIVSASHQFSDVPSSHTFHTAISRLYGARLTSGCSATRFCPSANVTRGQMAAFLNRSLGRGASTWGATGTANDWDAMDDSILDGVFLTHGGAPGGTGHVLVTANVSIYSKQAGTCPCELAVWLINEDTGEASPAAFQVILDIPGPPDSDATSWYSGTGTVSHLFTVPSGVRHTYLLGAHVDVTTAPSGDTAGAEWSLSAVYVPFGGDGGNPSLVTTQGTDGRRPH
jgi:hypothetical protein